MTKESKTVGWLNQQEFWGGGAYLTSHPQHEDSCNKTDPFIHSYWYLHWYSPHTKHPGSQHIPRFIRRSSLDQKSHSWVSLKSSLKFTSNTERRVSSASNQMPSWMICDTKELVKYTIMKHNIYAKTIKCYVYQLKPPKIRKRKRERAVRKCYNTQMLFLMIRCWYSIALNKSDTNPFVPSEASFLSHRPVFPT